MSSFATETPTAALDLSSVATTPSTYRGTAEGLSAQGPGGIPVHVAKHLIGGTAALGFGVFLERGAGFVANILAARFAGASAFGAYSLAITTANQISTYAAGGIGATATRFSGKYPYGGQNYGNLARVLALVSLVSAAIAALGLWLGAAPIAHLLGKTSLTLLLRWAAISAAGMILLECARGFFVGQRRLLALVLLSVLVGTGMLVLLPMAAHAHSPIRMIVSQGLITASAVVVCLLLARPLRLRATSPSSAPTHTGTEGARPFGLMLREVWSFGFVQLAGLVGSNLAGWWLTTLVARADTSLVQMSFFAIASQLRNLAGIAPSLLTEGSYAVMAEPDGETGNTPHRVMALCSFASLSAALMLAMAGIVFVPWAIRLSYGGSYSAAAVTVAIGLAIAVVHMGNAPAAARLTIVSIRSTGVINTVWAIFVAVCASLFLFRGGTAAKAMTIIFCAHVLSSCLVLLTLRRKDHVPAGMVPVFALGTVAVATLATLAFVRGGQPAHATSLTAAMFIVFLVASTALYLLGKRHRWLPSAAMVRSLLSRVTGLLFRLRSARSARGGDHV